MLPKFIQICLNLTCSSVKQGSCLQSCSSWASFPLRCLLIGSAPRFRPFFFVTSSSPTAHRADIISKFGFGKRLRKPRTAAGFVPKACKTQANKTLETSPTEPTKKKEKERKQAFRHRKKQFYTIARYARLESRRHHLEIWLWKTVAKASNSSRIRAQGMQNTSQ